MCSRFHAESGARRCVDDRQVGPVSSRQLPPTDAGLCDDHPDALDRAIGQLPSTIAMGQLVGGGRDTDGRQNRVRECGCCGQLPTRSTRVMPATAGPAVQPDRPRPGRSRNPRHLRRRRNRTSSARTRVPGCRSGGRSTCPYRPGSTWKMMMFSFNPINESLLDSIAASVSTRVVSEERRRRQPRVRRVRYLRDTHGPRAEDPTCCRAGFWPTRFPRRRPSGTRPAWRRSAHG